jgi:diguanylate cyclase (GGDEF)-like protein
MPICGTQLTAKGSAIDSPARDRRHRLLADQGSYVLEEVDIRRADGTIIPTLISAQRTVVDGVSFDVEIILDVSSRVRHQQEIERALMESARTDFLTGLPNRGGFEIELNERINARKDGQDLVLAFIDLNGFKPINDTMGHESGDEVLKTIASRLRDNFLNSSFIARIGGDEFVVLFQVAPQAAGTMLIEMRDRMNRIFKPVSINGQLADVGAAVGIALLQEGDTGASFTKRADSYMYIAKSTLQRIAVVALGKLGDTSSVEPLPAGSEKLGFAR